MKEIDQENLMRMFPKGYLIIYIQPNMYPAYSWYNPDNDELIKSCQESLQRAVEDDNLEGD